MDRGRSGLLDEPVWWDVGDSASPVCAEYEWAKDLPECSSWDVKAWESCAEFQVPAQRPSGSNLPATKPHCCIKPTKGRKRVPLCLGWTKAKKAKIKRPIFTWQMALNTGDTGMAVREAMEQAAELAGEGDTGEQPSAMAELEVHEATGQGQDGVAGRVLNTGGELLGGGCPDGHHCPGGKGCHHDQEGGLKLPRTEIGDEFLTDYSLDFCGSHPPATTGHDDSFAEQQSPDQEVIKVEPGVSSLGSARPFLDPSRHVATAMSLADPGNQAKMNSRSATSCHQPSEGGCLAEEAPTCPSEFYSPAWGAADLQQEKMGKTGDGGGRSKDVAENPDSTSPSPEDPRKPMPPVHQELEGCRRLSTPRTGQTDEEECGKNWAGDPSRPLQKLLESEAPEVADDKQDAMKAADAREKLFDPCKYGATGDPWISASAPTSRFAMQSSVGIIPTMPDLALGRIIAPCTDGYGQEDASAAEGADPTGMPMESTAEGQWGVHTAYPHPMPDADLLARELWCNWPQPSAGSQGKEENLPLGDPRADEPSISLKWVNGSVED